jgi:HK97 family phage major capsid protein
VPVVVTPPTAAFIAEGTKIRATLAGLGSVDVAVTKLAAIWGLTNDVTRNASDAALSMLERQFVWAVRVMTNTALLSDQAAIPLQQPAGLLNGLVSLGVASPMVISELLADMWRACRDGSPGAPAWIVSPKGAVYLATLRASDGAPVFPTINPVSGGVLLGAPVLIAPEALDSLLLVDGAAIATVDLGIEVNLTTDGNVEVENPPTGSASTTVSGFMDNTTFYRIIRYCDWAKGAADVAVFATLPLGSPA